MGVALNSALVVPWIPDRGPLPFAPGVQREEFVWGDIYSGRIDAMVASGLVLAGAIPGAPGIGRKTSISFDADGRVMPRGKVSKAPGSKSIQLAGKKLFVRVTASDDVQIARSAGLAEHRRALQQKASDAKSAEEKRRESEERYMREKPAECLELMPKNSFDFCEALIQDIRTNFHFCLDRATHASWRHGFTLTAEAAEGAALAFDAVAEALLSGNVAFDASRHTAIVHKLHTYLVQAGKGAPQQVAQVLRVNPSILAQEAS